MPSNQFVLAFHSSEPVGSRSLELRLNAVTDYVRSLHLGGQVVTSTSTGAYTGIVAWNHAQDSVAWPQLTSAGSRAAAWIDFPEHDARSVSTIDPLEFALMASRSETDIEKLGAPFACFYRCNDNLTIVNDALGLARFYEFSFSGITVWASRPSLAHIFSATPLVARSSAWAGMATLGWNLGGETHIGDGVQVSGYTRVQAVGGGGVTKSSRYKQWVQSVAETAPTWGSASEGIAHSMSLATYFDKKPVADLSGGKDSRVLAAAALSSGVTNHVRTLRTDHGEVETAERLVALYDGPVHHEIRDVSSNRKGRTAVDLLSRLELAQFGSEGSLLPVTALSGASFRGYVPPDVARFNGHGGESLHGGALYGGAWGPRLESSGVGGAVDRLVGMVRAPLGTSELGRERAVDVVRSRLQEGQNLGLQSAHGLLNYFYNSERMPFWSSSFANRSTITPYYSSGLLAHIARTFWGESSFPEFYSRVLRELSPGWESVPFYKPAGVARRATRYFWDDQDWTGLREYAEARAGDLENFDADAIVALLSSVDSGGESKAVEVALARFFWESSVDSVVSMVNASVRVCAAALARLP